MDAIVINRVMGPLVNGRNTWITGVKSPYLQGFYNDHSGPPRSAKRLPCFFSVVLLWLEGGLLMGI